MTEYLAPNQQHHAELERLATEKQSAAAAARAKAAEEKTAAKVAKAKAKVGRGWVVAKGRAATRQHAPARPRPPPPAPAQRGERGQLTVGSAVGTDPTRRAHLSAYGSAVGPVDKEELLPA